MLLVMASPLIYLCMNRVFHAAVMYFIMNIAIMLVFIYAPTEKMQGIVQKNFYFHVSSAITMSFAFFLVCAGSIMYSMVVFWPTIATPSSRHDRLLLGKQKGKEIFRPLPELELLVGIEDQCLDEGLSLLATCLPDGFDGQAPFRQ